MASTYAHVDEQIAYQQMVEHLRKAMECAVVLGTHRTDGMWGRVAVNLENMASRVTELRNASVAMRAR